MWIERWQMSHLREYAVSGKVVVIFGPRRVGKTELLKHYLKSETNYLFISGEDLFTREAMSSQSIDKLKSVVGDHSLLVIDEAQYIPNIGLNLKLLVDHLPHLRMIVTGSASFDLARQVGEPLTGRKHVVMLYPIAQLELNQIENALQTQAHRESRLIFGSYPEVITLGSDDDRRDYLHALVSDSLLKDILAFEGVQKSKKIFDLLTLIALQLGHEVSLSELATQLAISRGTVERYLDLLEQSFVVVNIRGFSRNLRKEVTKTSRYYFCDNGICNAILNNFNTLTRRRDIGGLWENYLVMERIKKQTYERLWSRNYFWRTYDQKELDWVEDREGELHGYEFKWGKASGPPKLWREAYPDATFECISPENYLPFIAN
ncbi:MAG: ATP-binding protein [Chlamydiia bacterium]